MLCSRLQLRRPAVLLTQTECNSGDCWHTDQAHPWHTITAHALDASCNPRSSYDDLVTNLQGFLWPGVHFAAQSQDAGPGLFGSMPLDVQRPDDSLVDAQLGARYASPALSTGIAFKPFKGACLEKWWLLWRHTPSGTPDTHMTFGAQSAPRMRLDEILDTGKAEQLVAPANTSYFLQYESGAKDSRFSIFVESIEVRRGAAAAAALRLCCCARALVSDALTQQAALCPA